VSVIAPFASIPLTVGGKGYEPIVWETPPLSCWRFGIFFRSVVLSQSVCNRTQYLLVSQREALAARDEFAFLRFSFVTGKEELAYGISWFTQFTFSAGDGNLRNATLRSS
jgi:hypothetical protein